MTTRHSYVCLAAVLLGLTAGCGTAAYEERLDARVEQLRKNSAFGQLYAAKPLGDTPVTIRVPQVFKQSLVEGSKVDGVEVDPRRVKPPLLALVGLKITYESFVTDAEGGKLPYYLYLVAEPLSQTGRRDFRHIWQGQLKEKFPGTGAWDGFQAPTAEGRAISWERLRVTGPQEFYYVDKAGKGSYITDKGLMIIDYREEGDYMVALIWRLPASLEPNVKVDELERLTAGTIGTQAK